MLTDSVIANKIKNFRIMRGYSQAKLAEELEIAPSAVAAYESGSRIPKINVREQIANVLNVDPVELSGINLSEDDEIRLLNKLLVKYCVRMESCNYLDNDGKYSCEGTNVILSYKFKPLEEKYTAYKKEIDTPKKDVQSKNSNINIDNATKDSESNTEAQNAFEEFEYWINTWPSYDYIYQEEKGASVPGNRHSIKEWLNAKLITEFINYKNAISK